MKRFTISILLALSVGGGSYAGTPVVFINEGVITNQFTNIVATTFINRGVFDTYALASAAISLTSDPYVFDAFATHQTFFYTNTLSGSMFGQPGFDFAAETSSGRRAATSFSDSGLIQNFDVQAEPDWVLVGGGAPPVIPSGISPAINAPVPSITTVWATNINVDGTIQVGDGGLLQLTGQNVTLRGGNLIAGTVDDSPTDTNATLGIGLEEGIIVNNVTYYAFSPAVDVWDICWGVSNATPLMGDVAALADVGIDAPTEMILDPEYPEIDGSRNGELNGDLAIDFFPLNGNPDAVTATTFSAANYTPTILTLAGTSNTFYVTIVWVNNAFSDTNITAEVGFIPSAPTEAMVKFSAPILDVVTGETVTNSIYLLDTGALEGTNYNMTNCIEHADGSPLSFQITRIEPVDWEDWAEVYGPSGDYPVTTVYDPTIIDGADEFKNATVPMNTAAYAAQIGRDPERPDGADPFTAALLVADFDLPDLTNEPGRVEINAQKLDVTGLTVRGNGVARIYATNLTGIPAAMDFGNFNSDLGDVKGALTVSNLYPVAFHRLRGDVLAWTADWKNTQTNLTGTPGFTNLVTNNYVYHILVVDQDLRSTFKPSALSLALRGSKVEVDDPLNVIGGALFQTTNLTLNASLNMTGNDPQLLTTNMPTVQNLLIGANGSISADIQINLDVPLSAGHVNPGTATYDIKTITNLNTISSGSIQLQAQLFANGGTVLSTNHGQILINSKTNLLGAGTGRTNSLTADTDINIYSLVVQATNSSIFAGQAGVGQLTIYAATELTDFLPNTASTNTYPTNIWQATDGFSLPVKPASGDLFGTQIRTIAAVAGATANHAWSGLDLGPSQAGFFNNAVIGHLILDRTSATATLRFSATGKKNAMYVDYLDLEDLSFSDYHRGLIVDPNFTIYFANANVDPSKINAAYSNIVWVPQFAGPNSTKVVPYKNGDTCLMNAALANSPDIDSDFSGIPNGKNNFPLDNPSAFVGAIPCPSLVTSAEIFDFATNNGLPQYLAIWTTGQGTITPALKSVKVGETLVLTALPAAGWSFLNWTGGMPSSQPTLSFVIPDTNAVLTANFVVDPFPTLAGTYNGLFYPATGITASNSGFVTFTVTSTGASSGKLLVGANSYPFTAQFYGSGLANVRATNGTNILTVTLQLDAAKLSDQATGEVANGSWQAALVADRAPVWTAKNPAPQAGYYTAILPGNTNAAASPGGDSYGTVTISTLGMLTTAGTLADGTGFSQSVPVSKEGQWPLYFSAPGGQTLLGWVTFGGLGLNGKVNWSKAAGSGAYYPAGFNTNSFLLGDKYTAPAGQAGGLNYTNGTLTLSGGNLAATVSDPVSLSGKVTFQSKDQTLTLTINPATGAFTGQYLPPDAGAKISLAGVVLPNEQVARGSFLGASQSGEVLLQDQ